MYPVLSKELVGNDFQISGAASSGKSRGGKFASRENPEDRQGSGMLTRGAGATLALLSRHSKTRSRPDLLYAGGRPISAERTTESACSRRGLNAEIKYS